MLLRSEGKSFDGVVQHRLGQQLLQTRVSSFKTRPRINDTKCLSRSLEIHSSGISSNFNQRNLDELESDLFITGLSVHNREGGYSRAGRSETNASTWTDVRTSWHLRCRGTRGNPDSCRRLAQAGLRRPPMRRLPGSLHTSGTSGAPGRP